MSSRSSRSNKLKKKQNAEKTESNDDTNFSSINEEEIDDVGMENNVNSMEDSTEEGNITFMHTL